jgi:hypothetical protein
VVARVEVAYGDPSGQEYLDLCGDFDDAGRATRFEEWPFFPGQPRVATV